MNRREFSNGLVRAVAVIAMAGGVWQLARHGKISRDEECQLNLPCSNCGKIKKCSLPEAKKYRENGQG